MIEVNEQVLLERAEKVRACAEIYRKYRYAEEIVSKRSKTFLAKLKMEVRARGVKMSHVDLEMEAMATESWIEFDKKNIDALQKAGEAELDYKVALTEFQAMQSALSSRKAEVRSFGG